MLAAERVGCGPRVKFFGLLVVLVLSSSSHAFLAGWRETASVLSRSIRNETACDKYRYGAIAGTTPIQTVPIWRVITTLVLSCVAPQARMVTSFESSKGRIISNLLESNLSPLLMAYSDRKSRQRLQRSGGRWNKSQNDKSGYLARVLSTYASTMLRYTVETLRDTFLVTPALAAIVSLFRRQQLGAVDARYEDPQLFNLVQNINQRSLRLVRAHRAQRIGFIRNKITNHLPFFGGKVMGNNKHKVSREGGRAFFSNGATTAGRVGADRYPRYSARDEVDVWLVPNREKNAFVTVNNKKEMFIFYGLRYGTSAGINRAVIAHECGHLSLRHAWKMLASGMLLRGNRLSLIGAFALHSTFGAAAGAGLTSKILRRVLFFTLNCALHIGSDLLSLKQSRLHEQEADLHATSLGYGRDLARSFSEDIWRDEVSAVLSSLSRRQRSLSTSISNALDRQRFRNRVRGSWLPRIFQDPLFGIADGCASLYRSVRRRLVRVHEQYPDLLHTHPSSALRVKRIHVAMAQQRLRL